MGCALGLRDWGCPPRRPATPLVLLSVTAEPEPLCAADTMGSGWPGSQGEQDGFCGFLGQSGTCRLQGPLGGGGGEAICHRSLTCCLPSKVVMVEHGAEDGPQGLWHRDLGCPAGRLEVPSSSNQCRRSLLYFLRRDRKGMKQGGEDSRGVKTKKP